MKLLKAGLFGFYLLGLSFLVVACGRDSETISKSDQLLCTKLYDSYYKILTPDLDNVLQYGERLLNIKSASSNLYPEIEDTELYEVVKDISNIEYGQEVSANRANFLNALTKIITVQKICSWSTQVVDPSL
jgi:hypothetical protein